MDRNYLYQVDIREWIENGVATDSVEVAGELLLYIKDI